MSWNLFLDDERFPKTDKKWVIARNNSEAIALVLANGCPNFISFDHDLGNDERAIDFLKWLIENDLDKKIQIPEDFQYNIHSANPVGAANINALLISYLNHKKRN